MARITGSECLFKLVHSLTAEEKGYFRKFAQRHSLKGGKCLRLFDAINKQRTFEEVTLKNKFRDYTVAKVYLKDMILDSLIMYNNTLHPQIDLLSQTQKIHILIQKGLPDEAEKFLNKALKQSRLMEVFPIERYLLRLYNALNSQKANNTDP